uniref:Uncharacterized protein n=1 Tax=Anguilla anguilla TaxID=7936 RepID=A0A0E9T7W8_ANGAN
MALNETTTQFIYIKKTLVVVFSIDFIFFLCRQWFYESRSLVEHSDFCLNEQL